MNPNNSENNYSSKLKCHDLKQNTENFVSIIENDALLNFLNDYENNNTKK